MLQIIFRSLFLFLFFFVMNSEIFSSQKSIGSLRIQLFSGYPSQIIKNIDVSGDEFKLIVFKLDGVDTMSCSSLYVTPSDALNFKANGSWGNADSIVVISQSVITVNTSNGISRRISGSLIFSSNEGQLLTIALLSVESYLIGVVDSELGRLDHPELWKAQAILARTWIIVNYNKFSKDGFSFGVTDDVRSQAFHGWPADPVRLKRLKDAVTSTSNMFVSDIEGNPIEALFHANSGGQTMPCGWYFNPRPALVSVIDTFSLKCPQTYWEKRIKKESWMRFMSKAFDESVEDTRFKNFAFSFKQPVRIEFMEYKGKLKRLRVFRQFFSLRSTWFSVEYEKGDFIVLKGRGYGHGIGMSQEGGLRMANYGSNALEILNFYYPKSRVVKF